MTNIKIISAVIWLLLSLPSNAYNPGNSEFDFTDPNNSDKTGCVYVESNGDWVVANCDYKGAHNACYDGTNWKIAQAIGTVQAPGLPIDGVKSDVPANSVKSIDSWDPGRADARCKDLYGPSYFFSVPTSSIEDEALDEVIRNELSVQVRRTWVYYFSNDEEVPHNANFWFGNRNSYAKSFIADNRGDNSGNADCSILNRNTGYWEDASCNDSYAYACFESGDWVVTTKVGEWRRGYAECDSKEGMQSLYATPRKEEENAALKAALQAVYDSASSADKAKYEKVWLNHNDLVFEEFFVSNQSRQAWWAESQPTNRRNADCTLMDHEGNWISESCDKFEAYHACNLGGEGQWALTSSIPNFKSKAIWSYGFGYCKRITNGEFVPPKNAASNAILAEKLSEGEFVWINYSDQDNEGAWKVENQYQDFVSFDSVVEGDNKDCGFYSNKSNSEGNWLTTQCFAGGVQRGFACTNGYEWKITTVKDDLWKKGFEECKTAFGPDYYFAAPSSADQNSRLGTALSLSGLTTVWLNLNDAEQEGTWVANGPIVNLAPVLTLPTDLVFNEKQDILLAVTAVDPENEGIKSYQWSVEKKYFDNTNSIEETPSLVLLNPATNTLTISAIDLLNKPLFVDVKVVVTDDAAAPSATTAILSLKILPPLKASYDFNSYTRPELDTSGNGHNLSLNLSALEITGHNGSNSDFYVDINPSESFSIDGSSSGLQVGADNQEYTLIYRFMIDEEPSAEWSGFVQKGSGGTRQPALFYQKSSKKIQYTNSTSSNPNEAAFSKEEVRIGQWMTVAYVKKGQDVSLFVDKAVEKLDDPVSLRATPDHTFALVGTSTGFTSGDWIFGNVPGAGVGIKGGFDDIKIYNRALEKDELNKIFVDQPRGRFEFSSDVVTGDESESDPGKNEISVMVDRIEGDDVSGQTEVSVGYTLVPDTALMGADKDFQLKAGTGIDVAAGTGALKWTVHDRAPKAIVIELNGDSGREGTESFFIELGALPTEPDVADRNRTQVDIIDKTPNPYGAIAFAASNGPIIEGQAGEVFIERAGTDTKGDYQITYEIQKLNADMPEDFTVTEAGFVIDTDANTTVLGTGTVTFLGNSSATPRPLQTESISLATVTDELNEDNEFINVLITGIYKKNPSTGNYTDPIDEENDAILGTRITYVQIIQDYSPGRISFTSNDYGSISEVGSASETTKEITFNRIEGKSGKLCVNLQVTGTKGVIDIDDYQINYLLASNGSGTNNVVYWGENDELPKTISIQAKADDFFELEEELVVTWAQDFGCAPIAPTLPRAGDVTSAKLKIVDVTADAALSFSAPVYNVSERGDTITVRVNNTGNKVNPFKVHLTRTNGSALAGPHYQILTQDQATLTFAKGADYSDFTINVYDNCVNTDQLTFLVGLDVSDALNPSGFLPSSKIKTNGSVATVAITNASPNIEVSVAASNDVTTNKAPLEGGRYRSTTASFAPSSMKLTSSNTTKDNCPLQYSWSYTGTSPSLPQGGSLPEDFSVIPTISGDQAESNVFVLPFVVNNSTVNYKLDVTHPEKGVVTKTGSISIGAYWRRIQNNGENDCVYADGGDVVKQGVGCGSATNANFTFNDRTKQIVHQRSGTPKCLHAGSGDDRVRYRNCAGGAAQQWSYSGDQFKANGRDVVEPYFPIWWSDFEVLGLTGNPGGYVIGSRTWRWTGKP